MTDSNTTTAYLTNDWIEALVPHKSFLDVGPLHKTIGEKLSVAKRAGASSLTAVDCIALNDISWKLLKERVRLTKGGDVCPRLINMDASLPRFRSIGVFDVVYCNGVLYHMTNPLGLLANLRAVTREHLILGTVFLSDSACESLSLPIDIPLQIVIPGMSNDVRELVSSVLDFGKIEAIGITQEHTNWDLRGYAPYWHLFNKVGLTNILHTIGFNVVDHFLNWDGKVIVCLCKAI